MACSMKEDDKNQFEAPIRALNISFRLNLSSFLNPEQPFFSSAGIARDYRGLAELMAFDHTAILNFQRYKNPTLAILEAWETKPGSCVGKLKEFLLTMERYDIVDDLEPQMKKDVELYRENQKFKSRPLQDSEITSCRPYDFPLENNCLTIDDSENKIAFYDAYVCYADSNLDFVRMLAEHLESPQIGIKLCIRDRNLVSGPLEYDSFVRIVEERCKLILIILSPEFLQTPECDYQAKFAASQASEHRNRRLIPIIYKACEVPAILKYISKVDFSRSEIYDWVWKKLICSIQAPSSRQFVSSNYPLALPSPPNSEPSSSTILALPSVPNSESFLYQPGTSTGTDVQLSPNQSSEKIALVPSPVPGNSKRRKFVEHFRSFMGNSSGSSGSSGFQSQSDA